MTEFIAYAQSFAAFLLSILPSEKLGNIKGIILFGSVARGEATKESDIDIFIDVFRDEKSLEKQIDRVVEDFYKSIFFEKYWKLLGIENEIKPIVGKLSEWKDLKTSIIANGITLYGKHVAEIKGKNFVLLSWKKIKPESKRVWLSKVLYGYNYKKRRYKGLLEIHDGKKISPNCILIPIENYPEVLKKFKHVKVTIKIFYISLL